MYIKLLRNVIIFAIVLWLGNLMINKFNELQMTRELEFDHNSIIKIEDTLQKNKYKFSKEANRILILTNKIIGSINLIGARIDDIQLLEYKNSLDIDEPVRLLKHASEKNGYFVEFGWYSDDKKIELPNSNTVWATNKKYLESSSPEIDLTWINNQNITFRINIALDSPYLLKIKQEVVNNSDTNTKLKVYGLVHRKHSPKDANSNSSHEGPIAVIKNVLEEYPYSKVKSKKIIKFGPDMKPNWLGIADKYWLVAAIPDPNSNYSTKIHTSDINEEESKFQIDCLSEEYQIDQGQTYSLEHKLFVGPKKVHLLDYYKDKYQIPLFDRAVDFGWLYILTKPIFHCLNILYYLCGNFGVSIILFTIIIKLLMLNLSNKGHKAIKKIQKLQPEIEKIKKTYDNDKVRMNQEILKLYKKERINPLNGCLPTLVQIPVLLSIYKVLSVTIEMRQAKFFGWIQDLSVPDTVSIVNLFGLLPFTPPLWLNIGVWPMLMAITMHIQQRISPQPISDPVQAEIMKFLPIFLLFFFNGYPVGLVIYWTWTNLLSIAQQYYVNLKYAV